MLARRSRLTTLANSSRRVAKRIIEVCSPVIGHGGGRVGELPPVAHERFNVATDEPADNLPQLPADKEKAGIDDVAGTCR
jgi:hypothetical protein